MAFALVLSLDCEKRPTATSLQPPFGSRLWRKAMAVLGVLRREKADLLVRRQGAVLGQLFGGSSGRCAGGRADGCAVWQ